jgi:serine/threonine protein kinase
MTEAMLNPLQGPDTGVPLLPEDLLPGMQVNGFRLVRYVDQGGYGCVWLAESIYYPGQSCALKFSLHPPGEDRAADARALREVILLMQAAHPNVVGVLGYGRWKHPKGGILYVVLQWVEGATLLEWACKANPSLRQVVRLAQKLGLALQAAHEKGVMHRDVKPDNVLVQEADGEPFLADFGLGETERSTPLTWGGLPPGTRHYLSPEALAFSQRGGTRPYRFQPADDWYALGVTLYQLLTEVLPFPDGQGGAAYEEEALRRRPVPPHLLNPRVPVALSQVVMRLLAKSPKRRYRSGKALWEALDRALAQPGRWEEPVYEPGPPQEPDRAPTREPSPGDGPPAEDVEVAFRHAIKRDGEREREEQRRAAALSQRDALLPGQPRAWPPVVRKAGAVLVLVLMSVAPLPLLRMDPGLPSNGTSAALPAPEGAAASPSQPSLVAAVTTAQKEDSPVKTPQSPPPQPPPAPPRQRTAKGSKGAAVCAIGVMAGCTGIPVRPPAKDCPPAAIRAMHERGVRIPGPSAEVRLHASVPGGLWDNRDEVKFVAGQKVISEVTDPRGANFPKGSLLFGKVVAGGDGLFFIRYEEAQVADTPQRVPICAEAIDSFVVGTVSLRMGPKSTGDTFTHSNRGFARWVLHFPGDL